MIPKLDGGDAAGGDAAGGEEEDFLAVLPRGSQPSESMPGRAGKLSHTGR